MVHTTSTQSSLSTRSKRDFDDDDDDSGGNNNIDIK